MWIPPVNVEPWHILDLRVLINTNGFCAHWRDDRFLFPGDYLTAKFGIADCEGQCSDDDEYEIVIGLVIDTALNPPDDINFPSAEKSNSCHWLKILLHEDLNKKCELRLIGQVAVTNKTAWIPTSIVHDVCFVFTTNILDTSDFQGTAGMANAYLFPNKGKEYSKSERDVTMFWKNRIGLSSPIEKYFTWPFRKTEASFACQLWKELWRIRLALYRILSRTTHNISGKSRSTIQQFNPAVWSWLHDKLRLCSSFTHTELKCGIRTTRLFTNRLKKGVIKERNDMVRNLLTGKTDDAVLHLMTLFGNASMSGTGGRVPLLRLQKEKKSGSIFLLVNNNDHIRTLMGISGVNSVDQQRNLSVMFSFKESSGCTSSLTTTLIYHSLNRDNAIIQRFLDNNGDWREHIDDDGDAEMDEGGAETTH